MPDYSDNKFGSRKLRKGLKIPRIGIIRGDGKLENQGEGKHVGSLYKRRN